MPNDDKENKDQNRSGAKENISADRRRSVGLQGLMGRGSTRSVSSSGSSGESVRLLSPDQVDTLIGNILLDESFAPAEVLRQYEAHQSFLIGALDDKEELKSRIAFADAYQPELAAIHKKIMKQFGLTPGEHEFDYLNSELFREAAGKDGIPVLDLMKDYMSLQYTCGKLSKETYERCLQEENEREREFRTREIGAEERSFLISASGFSGRKKAGIRECRKWMYRNCSKSGLFNETGTKRDYIDAFGKCPVEVQANTLYLIERGHYRYKEAPGAHAKEALSDSYVPDLKAFRGKMKRNALRLYSKVRGELFLWSRMERALKKSRLEQQKLKDAYEARGTVKERPETGVSGGEADWIREFEEEKNLYFRRVEEYLADKTKIKRDRMLEVGNRIQRQAKINRIRPDYPSEDAGRERFEGIVKFTEMIADGRDKMDDKTITLSMAEAKRGSFENILFYRSIAGAVYSAGGKSAAVLAAGSEAADFVGNSLGVTAKIALVYYTIRDYTMSVISHLRRKKATGVKKELKELGKDDRDEEKEAAGEEKKTGGKEAAGEEKRTGGKEAAGEEKQISGGKLSKEDAGKINAMARVSRKNNAEKRKVHAVGAVMNTVTGIATVVGMTATTVIAAPATIAATVIGGTGSLAVMALESIRNKRVANKAIDSRAKMEDEDYQQVPDGHGGHKRYIDAKADEWADRLREKKERFEAGSSGRRIIGSYLKDPGKIKARIRTRWAVERGDSTIYSFRKTQDRENQMEAYRNLFLKDPEGPIDEKNLIRPEELTKYLSGAEKDLEETQQTAADAHKRVLYRKLLESEGLKSTAPKDVKEAKELFEAKTATGRKDAPKTEPVRKEAQKGGIHNGNI